MKTKWANNTVKAINSGDIAEGLIRSIRRITAGAINDHNVSCTREDAEAILEITERVKPRVSAAQARKGADWLHNSVFTPRGNVRNTDFAACFRESDRKIVQDCFANPCFRLIGFYDTRESSRWCALFPIYRCYGSDGNYFDYVARSWQSGGNFFIVNRGC